MARAGDAGAGAAGGSSARFPSPSPCVTRSAIASRRGSTGCAVPGRGGSHPAADGAPAAAVRCGELYEVNRDTLLRAHKPSETFLKRMMSLYIASHYKNTPNDLQLMADAPAHRLFVLLAPPKSAQVLPDILCVVQVALEGAINRASASSALAAGQSPQGDLIPWTVATQFQDPRVSLPTGARRSHRRASRPPRPGIRLPARCNSYTRITRVSSRTSPRDGRAGAEEAPRAAPVTADGGTCSGAAGTEVRAAAAAVPVAGIAPEAVPLIGAASRAHGLAAQVLVQAGVPAGLPAPDPERRHRRVLRHPHTAARPRG